MSVTKIGSFVFASILPILASPALNHLPLRFEPNQGQAPGLVDGRRVQFLARGHGYVLTLASDHAWFQSRSGVIGMRLTGANRDAAGRGEERQLAVSSYFTGDRSHWRTGIPNYGRVRFEQVYSGIDVVYYGDPRRLEYDFVVAPGADASLIQLEFSGASGVRVDVSGDLVLSSAAGELRQNKPRLYQEIGGARRSIQGGYRLTADGRIGFAVGAYDRGRPLIIDPVLQFSTFYGGRLRESAHAMALDGAGNLYVAGLATSPDFPVSSNAAQDRVTGGQDLFVVKLNPTGTTALYSTLIGGSSEETLGSMVVDPLGNVYIGGSTISINFPTTSGVMKNTAPAGDKDGFVCKLNPAGTVLLYSTRIGGSGADSVNAVAVDQSGNAHVTGDTVSTDFPVSEEIFQTERKGSIDTFVTKLRADASAIIWSTFLGGDSDSFIVPYESGRAIAVDRAGIIYVAGVTTLRDFPVSTAAPQTTHLGQSDVYFSRLSSDGKTLIFSTLLGGEGVDTVNGMFVEPFGTNIYLVGDTISRRYPVTPLVVQGFLSEATNLAVPPRDGFVTKMNASGQLVYSTFFGGNGDDQINAIVADPQGNAYFIGTTTSTDLATTFDAIQKNINTGSTGEPYDAFVAYLDPLGQQIIWASYFGGTRTDNGNAIARDANGNVYLGGYTQSASFPLTPGALQRATGFGTSTAFIARIGDSRPGASKLLILSGDGQSGDQGTPARQPLVVSLRDEFNNPIVGAIVNFSATNATISGNAVTTDRNGEARVLATFGDRPGPARVTARSGELTVIFNLTSVRVGPPLPQIRAGGVISAGQSNPPVRALSIGARGLVVGSQFAPDLTDARPGPADMIDGKLPTSFQGICLTVSGVAARLAAVGAGLIEFIVPEVSASGPVPVVVIKNCGQPGELRSDPETVELRSFSPEFFYWNFNSARNPVMALNAETGAQIGPANVPGFNLVAGRPNDMVTVLGTGFGSTNPAVPPGEAATGPAPVLERGHLFLDGRRVPDDRILYMGLAPDQPGIYVTTFRIPADVRNGDLSLTIRFGLEQSPSSAFLRIAGGLDLNPQVAVSPQRLEFGEVITGQTRQLPLTVGNSGSYPLTVTSLGAALNVVTVTDRVGFRLEPGETRVVTVSFSPAAVGVISTTIAIVSDDPQTPTLNVPVTGTGIGQPPELNPVPSISSLSPATVESGGAPFNLVVNGSGFVRGSVVEVRGRPRSTFFNHPAQLIAYLQALDILDPGDVAITVRSPEPGGGVSNTVNLVVRGDLGANRPLGLINQFDLAACPVVISYVSVLDANGLPVRNITADRVTCREDDQTIPCTVAPGAAEAPASVTIVFGMNGVTSAEDQILLRSAARAFVSSLGQDDRVSLIHLEDQARPLLPFTTEKDRVLALIDQLRPVEPGNALYDAVVTAAQLFRTEARRRQMIVLFTARDNLSGVFQDPNQALGTARAAGTPFFTVALGSGTTNPNLTGFLRQLSRDTFGQFFTEASGLNYNGLLQRISTIFQSQYAVTTSGLFVDGRTKPLSFTFTTPDGPVVATRTYAPCLR
jgi:uncharacterized protein (TIGR03437 family)